MKIGVFVCMVFIILTCKAYASEPREYCIMETFTAECKYDGVIMITHAAYGRMRLGKCVTRDRGNIMQTFQSDNSQDRI